MGGFNRNNIFVLSNNAKVKVLPSDQICMIEFVDLWMIIVFAVHDFNRIGYTNCVNI